MYLFLYIFRCVYIHLFAPFEAFIFDLLLENQQLRYSRLEKPRILIINLFIIKHIKLFLYAFVFNILLLSNKKLISWIWASADSCFAYIMPICYLILNTCSKNILQWSKRALRLENVFFLILLYLNFNDFFSPDTFPRQVEKCSF